MPTTEMTIAGAGANLAGIGTVAWSDPGNITESAGNDATCTLNTQASNWLRATNFGFAIPDNAVILGVQVRVGDAHRGLGGTMTITGATLIVEDAVAGTAKTLTTEITSNAADYDIGGAGDVWGCELTPEIVNSSGFGWAVSMTGTGSAARVDEMSMAVTYQIPGIDGEVGEETILIGTVPTNHNRWDATTGRMRGVGPRYPSLG